MAGWLRNRWHLFGVENRVSGGEGKGKSLFTIKHSAMMCQMKIYLKPGLSAGARGALLNKTVGAWHSRKIVGAGADAAPGKVPASRSLPQTIIEQEKRVDRSKTTSESHSSVFAR